MKLEENSKNNKDKNKIILNKDIDLYKVSIKTLKESKLSDFKGGLFNEIFAEMLKTKEENNSIMIQKEINKNIPKKIIKINNYKGKNISKSPADYKTKKIQKIHSFSKNNTSNSKKIIVRNKLANSTYLNNKTLMKGKYNIILKEFKIEKIIFQMKYNTQMGEDLAVIGSINELGCWNQGRALRMNWNDGNIWKGSLIFNDKNIFDFEYKFIFISKGCVKQWEDGYNRKFILSQIKGLIESWPGGGNIIHLKNISGQNMSFNYNDNTLTIICEWNKK